MRRVGQRASRAASASAMNCGGSDTGTEMSCFQLEPSGFWPKFMFSRSDHMAWAWAWVWATAASAISPSSRAAVRVRSRAASAPPGSPLAISISTIQG